MDTRKTDIQEAPVEVQHAVPPVAPTRAFEIYEVSPERPKRTTIRILAILTALYLSIFIAALDQTIMATSIPTISAQLHSATGYFWIGGAYLLANAASGPIWAKASDIWGRKPALLASVSWFAGASIIAALSRSMRMLIAARALQGVAGGGLIELVVITLSDLFSVRQRTLFIGLVEIMWAIAGGAGPLIGGAFTQKLSWRWCFWINLPVSSTAFVLLLLFLDVHNPQTKLRDGLFAIDWAGTLSIVAVTLMLLLGLDFGGATYPWNSPTVICLIIFGVVSIGFFLFSEKSLAKYPLMPLQIFNNRSTCAAFAVDFMHGMCYMAASYYLPLFFQSAKQAAPLRSGVLVLPVLVPEAIMGIGAGLIMHRTGRYREMIWAGLTLLTLGAGLYILFSPTTPLAQLVGFQIIFGIGSGALFDAPLIAIQNLVKQADTATATATFGFVRNIAAATSIVVGGVVFQNGMDSQASRLRDAGLNSTIVEALSNGNAAANVDLIATISDASQRMVVQEAFAWSLRNMWIMYTCIAGIGLLASLFIAHNQLNTEHTETKTGIPVEVPAVDGR